MKKEIQEIVSAELKYAGSITNDEGWREFWKRFNALPKDARYILSYELRKNFPSWCRSGAHWYNPENCDPFSFCGWADFYCEELHRDTEGVGFKINRECFDGRDVELYYMDEHFAVEYGDDKFLQRILPIIIKYSSGLTDVHISIVKEEKNSVTFRGDSVDYLYFDEENMCQIAIIKFKLDSKKIKENISLNEKIFDTDEFGGYVFVLPRFGEFYCELGEIIDGKRVTLHIDDFCMK